MAREGNINAAGGFLRALRDQSGPGGQAIGAPSLPVKELLLLVAARQRTIDELVSELETNAAVVRRAAENLKGLGLVGIRAGEHDFVSITDLGREVAENQIG